MYSSIRFCRPLGLLFLCLSLLLVIVPSAASQDDGAEPPHIEAPPREWATLDVTAQVKDSLTDDIGRETVIPVTITNNGNIAATGVVAAVEGGSALAGKPVEVGDLPPGVAISVDLPFDILGRSAYPIPFSIRVMAENISYPTIVGVEQSFAGLNPDDYVVTALDADVLLEQSYDRYDGGFERPQPLLWFESRDKAADSLLTVDLKPLLLGEPPEDLVTGVLYYPDEKELPIPVEAKYDPATLSLTFASLGEGRYLIEWSRPAPKDDSADEAGLEGIEAVTVTEPELPQGWTPS